MVNCPQCPAGSDAPTFQQEEEKGRKNLPAGYTVATSVSLETEKSWSVMHQID